MHNPIPLLLAASALAVAGTAQEFVGFSYNVETGATSRGSLGVAAGEIMTRIDGSEYAGWGVDTPGFRTISSIFMIIQDQDAVATSEVFDVLLYPEDPANPGYPDLLAGVTFATGVAGPPAPATGVIAAASRVITPATPVAVPITGGGSVFVSFVFAAATWSTDGLSAHMCLGYQPTASFTVFDIPGQAQMPVTPSTPANSHGLTVPAGGAAAYSTRRHWIIDVEHSTSGGVVMGITNQASAAGSNNPPPTGFGPAPGTADFMSGVAPDVSQFDPTRQDEVCMDYFRTGSGSPLVFFLYDLGGFSPEVPLSAYLAGSTGVSCMNSMTMIVAGLVIGSADEAFLVTPFAAGARPYLVGFPLIQQAIEFDTVNRAAYGSPCGRQVF